LNPLLFSTIKLNTLLSSLSHFTHIVLTKSFDSKSMFEPALRRFRIVYEKSVSSILNSRLVSQRLLKKSSTLPKIASLPRYPIVLCHGMSVTTNKRNSGFFYLSSFATLLELLNFRSRWRSFFSTLFFRNQGRPRIWKCPCHQTTRFRSTWMTKKLLSS
jgi:hypothetical protein